jgi:hypothetical protein
MTFFLRPFAWVLVVALLPLLGCKTTSSSAKDDEDEEAEVVARFLFEASGNEAGVGARLPTSGTGIRVSPKAFFIEHDIEKAEAVENEFGRSIVFTFTPEATRELYRSTVTRQGLRIVTTINGMPLGAAIIRRPLSEGLLVTYLEVPDERLDDLAREITKTSEKRREELKKADR